MTVATTVTYSVQMSPEQDKDGAPTVSDVRVGGPDILLALVRKVDPDVGDTEFGRMVVETGVDEELPIEIEL